MPNRGRVTQHTIQPHVASKPANILPGHAVQEQPEISPHAPKKGPGSAVTLPNYCFQPARTGVSCDPTPMVFYCACHTFVLPYILEGQLRPYPPQRGRVTTDSKEVGSQPTPLPLWACAAQAIAEAHGGSRVAPRKSSVFSSRNINYLNCTDRLRLLAGSSKTMPNVPTADIPSTMAHRSVGMW